MNCPAYLYDYREEWRRNPHAANLKWFTEADYGLFLHYGLYTQLQKNEWSMFKDRIPVAEYEQLAQTFDPEHFDADFITDLACEAGMRYVNLTTCHHEGFCLWDSKVEVFNSVRMVGRDLVAELAAQCDAKGLGFFAYYTHVLNWRHPYALTSDRCSIMRPDYPDGDPRYILTDASEWPVYWAYAQACMLELCEINAPLAGIWLDIIKAYYEIPELIPIEETYDLIRAARPEALIAYKNGATGTEDFAAPEFRFKSQGDQLRKEGKEAAAQLADRAWAANADKHNEICMTLQKGSWGYAEGSPFKTADELWESLTHARTNRCNLLANLGPRPDGSLPPEGVALLREVGDRLRREGMPA